VLHETVVVVIASFVLTWEPAPGIEFLLISTASLVVTLLLCEFAVRRSPVTRMLFGLKPVSRHDWNAGRHGSEPLITRTEEAGVQIPSSPPIPEQVVIAGGNHLPMNTISTAWWW
jgi:hypothetical protein